MSFDPKALKQAVGHLVGGHCAIEAMSSDEKARQESTRALDAAVALAPLFAEDVTRTRAAMADLRAKVIASATAPAPVVTTDAPIGSDPTSPSNGTGT